MNRASSTWVKLLLLAAALTFFPGASSFAQAGRMILRVDVESADGLSSREAEWALDWGERSECSVGTSAGEYPLEIRVDRRGRVVIGSYEGPAANCIRAWLRETRFPLGRPATVQIKLRFFELLPGMGFSNGGGGHGSSSGLSWRGAAPRGDTVALEACRPAEGDVSYDVQVTIAEDGSVEELRVLSPRRHACVQSALRSMRFSRPEGGGAITLRFSLTLGQPMIIGGSHRGRLGR